MKGTISAVSTLQEMVREKQREIEILEKDRDLILQAVAQVWQLIALHFSSHTCSIDEKKI